MHMQLVLVSMRGARRAEFIRGQNYASIGYGRVRLALVETRCHVAVLVSLDVLSGGCHGYDGEARMLKGRFVQAPMVHDCITLLNQLTVRASMMHSQLPKILLSNKLSQILSY